MVVGFAALHYASDAALAKRVHSIPAGVPVVLSVVPVGYAAVRYGLSGSDRHGDLGNPALAA